MTGLGILLLVVVFFWIFWPMISRWLKRKAIERAEDYMRASMGMPPRDKSKKSETNQRNYKQGFYNQRRNSHDSGRRNDEPIIPKEYAEDVEFTETKEYSASYDEKHKESYESFHESQISDAEWTEIKKPGAK